MVLLFGEICDIDDPLKNGRYRVRVFHIHDASIPVENLPWSSVMIPATSASTSGVGTTPRLLVGTHVVGCFLDAFQQHFVILGTFFGVNDYPDIAKENYPLNQVTVSESGHSLQFNDATGEVILSASNGNNLTLKASVDVKSISDINLDSDGDTGLNVGGNLLVGSNGSATIFSQGAMNIGSSSGIILSAPRIDLNPSFSFAEPGLTDVALVKVKTRKAIIPLVNSSTGISQKDDIIVEKIEPGNICSLETPKNLYDVAFETIDTSWNDDSINVLFEEIGFPENTYDGQIYWGVAHLGAVLKRAGFKYLKSSVGFDYLIYENSSDVKKELTVEELQKGDVIIFNRNDSYFVGISDGTRNTEYNYYSCIVPDYDNGVYVADIYINDEVQVKRIFRPRACNDNKIFYNGDCTLPKIKTGFMINDDLISMALCIYFEALSETQVFPEDIHGFARGKVAVGYVIMNRLDLLKKYGRVNGYGAWIQKFRQPSQQNPLTISGIVFAAQQFSWTNAGAGGISNWSPTNKEKWCECLTIAEKVINREIKDPTDINNIGLGSTFYFNPSIANPAWEFNLLKTGWKPYQIQRHRFFIPPNTKPLA